MITRGLRSIGYTVVEKGADTLILTPHWKAVMGHLPSPVFVDGALSCDGKTIMHAACVTTANTIVLMGLVICGSETADSTCFLLNSLKCDSKPTFITDGGKAMFGAIKRMGDRCPQMPCTWHLAKQLPRDSKGHKNKLQCQSPVLQQCKKYNNIIQGAYSASRPCS